MCIGSGLELHTKLKLKLNSTRTLALQVARWRTPAYALRGMTTGVLHVIVDMLQPHSTAATEGGVQ
jgi:hypothetical protein